MITIKIKSLLLTIVYSIAASAVLFFGFKVQNINVLLLVALFNVLSVVTAYYVFNRFQSKTLVNKSDVLAALNGFFLRSYESGKPEFGNDIQVNEAFNALEKRLHTFIHETAKSNAAFVGSPFYKELSSATSTLLQSGQLDALNADSNSDDPVMRDLKKTRALLLALTSDVHRMKLDHEDGEVDSRLAPESYTGLLSELCVAINKMTDDHIKEKREMIQLMYALGDGDFDVEVPQYPNKKSELNKNLDRLKGKLKGVLESVRWVTQEHEKGNIDMTLHEHMFKGGLGQIASAVNNIVAGHINVYMKAMSVVKQFGEGNFNAPLEQFPGNKSFINETIEQVRSNLKALNHDANLLSQAAKNGKILTRANSESHSGDYRQIVQGMNNTLEMIVTPIRTVHSSIEAINTAAKEIAQGNSDLSKRTEDQASSLEKTASSMEQLSAIVKKNASSAKQASVLSNSASSIAQKGEKDVDGVISTMNEIGESSRKIEEIISVIDGIAFQTNILALNAAVEAARAGEQGRGFAVVAGEVRNLAQRSSSAAKEIKDLINDSVAKTSAGMQQVKSAGLTMGDLLSSVTSVNTIISEIANASEEQSIGIQQINDAVIKMDEVTQQNTALVEQAAAAAESLQEQAHELLVAVSVFEVNN